MEKSSLKYNAQFERNEREIPTIAEEAVAFLHFPKQEVLRLRQELKERTDFLLYLMNQLNVRILQVRILFEDIAGAKKIDATLTKVLENELIIHPDMRIPIHRIKQIRVIE